ncbi:MAG: PAS domain-containing sensor histidine kinase [Deltaproteobacteria bacterium]|nr:PAS domain-containing sensor histidine kinase [Deltaproteobacteria bacterium]
MDTAPSPDSRALLSKLLQHASQGMSRVEFFRSVSQALLDASTCDTIEIFLREPRCTYRCFLSRKQGGSFHFGRQQHETILEGRESTETTLATLRRSLAPAQFKSTQHGSFFAGDIVPTDGSRSIALVPVVAGLDEIGVMVLHSGQPGFFTDTSMESCEHMADALALSLVYQRAQWATRERVKELTCLYSIAQVADQHELSVDRLLQRVAATLPAGWQYPEICQARIVLDRASFESPRIGEPIDTQTADIVIAGIRRGVVEISYSDKRPEFDEGPFLQEERTLINEAARQIALIVQRRLADEERGRLQEQLRHADRLATIGQLAAGVAHELNEPLGAVLGFAQLAKKSPRLPRQAAQDLDRIVRAALHAREVVKKLMVFGRQTPPQKSLVQLNRLIGEGLELVRPRCDSEGVAVQCTLEPGLPAIVADPNQIQQVLVNLVVNAVQAMPGGGTITIATSNVPGAVSLSVEDTGSGMTEEVLKNIFVPFFTTKNVGQGTGLGLCVVHGIVTSHGGTIQVDSKVGRGTRFDVRLPASVPTQ